MRKGNPVCVFERLQTIVTRVDEGGQRWDFDSPSREQTPYEPQSYHHAHNRARQLHLLFETPGTRRAAKPPGGRFQGIAKLREALSLEAVGSVVCSNSFAVTLAT